MTCLDVIISLFLVIATFGFIDGYSTDFNNCAGLHYRREHRKGRHSYDPFIHFSYNDRYKNGPSNWPGSCNNGIRQSPIVYDQVEPVNKPCNVLEMTGAFDKKPIEIYAKNNGQGAIWSFIFEDESVPQISGGPLGDDIFDFSSFKFKFPCEHISEADKKKCQLELQLVHFNNKYKTIQKAATKVDGLAIVSLRFEVSDPAVARKLPFLDMLKEVEYFDDSTYEYENIFTYKDVLGFTEFPLFVSYRGSLTEPACTESVTWIIIDTLQSISAHDLKKFKQTRGEDNHRLIKNNRPVQPLNGRKTFIYNEF